MVDNISILVSHVALGVALWRLLRRDDLDWEAPVEPSTPVPAPPASPGWRSARDA